MQKRIRRPKGLIPKGLILWTALALTPALAPAAAQAQSGFQTVMSGLDNPYGLAFSPTGGLFVAEAGSGNHGATTGPGFVAGNGEPVFFGDTGAVSELRDGIQTRVVSNLPSLAGAGAAEATGLQGLSFDKSGNLYGVLGLGGTEAQRQGLVSTLLSTTHAGSTNAGDLGQVVRLNPTYNTITPMSDLVPYETVNYTKNNPDGQKPEANPYSLAPLPNGGFAVADGGGNVVLSTLPGGGAPSLLTLLPDAPNPLPYGPPSYQSVPTALTEDSKGNLFVGEFTGFPFPAGGADVFSLNETTGKSSVFASGFTTITGLAFGPNGDLYVLDDTNGGLGPHAGDAQIFQFDPMTGVTTLLTDLAAGSTYSSMIAGPDDALYISDLGAGPGDGSVLRFSLAAVPEASTTVSFGLLLALGLGGLAVAAKRKKANAEASTVA